jgi:hypothetical protein
MSESVNALRTIFTDKRKNYWSTFGGRCYFVVLWKYFGATSITLVLQRLGVPMSTESIGKLACIEQARRQRNLKSMTASELKKRAMRKRGRAKRREQEKVISAAKKDEYFKETQLVFPLGSKVAKARTKKKDKAALWQQNKRQGLWQCGDCQRVFCQRYTKKTHKKNCKPHTTPDTISSIPNSATGALQQPNILVQNQILSNLVLTLTQLSAQISTNDSKTAN